MPVVSMSLTYVLSLCTSLQATQLEVNMNAVERVTEYSPLQAEAEGQEDVLHVPPEWPSKGAIEVQDLVVSDVGLRMGPLLECPGAPAVGPLSCRTK